MKIWAAIFIVAFITYLERAAFVLLLSHWQLPDWFVRALRFVPVAVFPALIAPLFFISDGALTINPANPRIIGGAIATAVAWRSKNLLATIVVGMLAYWAAAALIG